MLGFEEAENGNHSNQVEDDYLKDMSTKIMKESVSNDGTLSMVHGDQIHEIGEMKKINSYMNMVVGNHPLIWKIYHKDLRILMETLKGLIRMKV